MKDNITIQTDAFQILDAALAEVDPSRLISDLIHRHEFVLDIAGQHVLDLASYSRIFIFGAGKGVPAMAKAMEKLLSELITDGLVITKYGHAQKLEVIEVMEAGHPLPDNNSLQASRTLLQKGVPFNENDLVIFLLTGGGSTLLEVPPDQISLSDLQKTNELLLGSGATIKQVNAVRKHISLVKGGQLLTHFSPADVVTLILSDVIGNDPADIASGPTSPDHTTFEDAIRICEQLKIVDDLPASVRDHLIQGAAKIVKETPDRSDEEARKAINIILGDNRRALDAAQRTARHLGYDSMIYTSSIQGEAREVSKVISALMTEVAERNSPLARPACLLFGGEPTVTINGKGKGGRNQELALALAATHLNFEHFFISCGSDGTDGPTDAAGAMVSHHTLTNANLKNLDIETYLNTNDSYHFFEKLGDLIKTGPTGTNVMDLMIALIPA